MNLCFKGFLWKVFRNSTNIVNRVKIGLTNLIYMSIPTNWIVKYRSQIPYVNQRINRMITTCSTDGFNFSNCWRVPIARNSVLSSLSNSCPSMSPFLISLIQSSIARMASSWVLASSGLKLTYGWVSSAYNNEPRGDDVR